MPTFKQRLSSGFAIASLIFLAGCSQRLIDFTIISTKNIDLTRMAEFQRGKTRANGEDVSYIIIFIPTSVPNPKEAVDKAIESVPGAVALLDGVMYSKWWWIPYIFGRSWYVVEGTPLIDTKLASAQMQSRFTICRLNRQGAVVELKHVNESEYFQERRTLDSYSKRQKI